MVGTYMKKISFNSIAWDAKIRGQDTLNLLCFIFLHNSKL